MPRHRFWFLYVVFTQSISLSHFHSHSLSLQDFPPTYFFSKLFSYVVSIQAPPPHILSKLPLLISYPSSPSSYSIQAPPPHILSIYVISTQAPPRGSNHIHFDTWFLPKFLPPFPLHCFYPTSPFTSFTDIIFPFELASLTTSFDYIYNVDIDIRYWTYSSINVSLTFSYPLFCFEQDLRQHENRLTLIQK